MNAAFLETQLVAYLSLREALGFQMRAEKILLPDFVAFVQAQGITGPIRAQLALEWACQTSASRGPSGAARRLSIARGFLIYLQASAPDTEVPDSGLLPSPRRPKPYLFTPTQLTALLRGRPSESAARLVTPAHLIHADRSVGQYWTAGGRGDPPSDRSMSSWSVSRRSYTSSKRSSTNPGLCHSIPAPRSSLRHYREQRARLHYDALSDAFFVSEQGQPLRYLALHDWFARLCQRLALAADSEGAQSLLDVVSAYVRGDPCAAVV